MNGIDPVIIATGNDWRAIEAGAHAYAARDGRCCFLRAQCLADVRAPLPCIAGRLLALGTRCFTVEMVTYMHRYGARAARQV
jgi:hypothetical protein